MIHSSCEFLLRRQLPPDLHRGRRRPRRSSGGRGAEARNSIARQQKTRIDRHPPHQAGRLLPGSRVARWPIFKLTWVNFGGIAMEDVVVIFRPLVHCTFIWYILWLLGNFFPEDNWALLIPTPNRLPRFMRWITFDYVTVSFFCSFLVPTTLFLTLNHKTMLHI
jgi:hypothetical protein